MNAEQVGQRIHEDLDKVEKYIREQDRQLKRQKNDIQALNSVRKWLEGQGDQEVISIGQLRDRFPSLKIKPTVTA